MSGTIGAVFVEILPLSTGLAAKLESDIKSATTKAQAVAGDGFSNIQKAGITAFAAVGAAALAVGVKAVEMASNFDASMTKVQALTGASASEVKSLTNQVLALAPAVGIGPTALADALYFVESAGFHGAQAMDILTQSAKASASGLGDVKTVADAVTSAMNAYGPANLSAGAATDELVKAVALGKVPADALAGSLGRVTASAATLGVTFPEVLANIATLTRTGMSASQAATSLLQVTTQIEKMLIPTQNQASAFAQLGINGQQVVDVMKNQGLAAALQLIIDKAGGNTLALEKLFPNIRALRDALGTAGAQGVQYAQILGQITNASAGAGANTEAFRITQESFKQKVKEVVAQTDVWLIQLGNALIPKIEAAGSAVLATVQFFEQNRAAQAALAAVIAGLVVPALASLAVELGTVVVEGVGSAVAAIGGMIDTLTTFALTAASVGPAEAAMGIGLDAMLGPIGLVAGAIGALVLITHQSKQEFTGAKQAGQDWANSFAQQLSAQGGSAADTIAKLSTEIGILNRAESDGIYISAEQARTGQSYGAVIAQLQAEVKALTSQQTGLKASMDAANAASGIAADKAKTQSAAEQTLNGWMKDLGVTQDDVTAATARATGQTTAQVAASQKAAAAATALAKQTSDAKAAFDNAAAASKILVDQLNELVGVHVSALQAAVDYQNKMAALTKAFTDNGKSIDITTASGRLNTGAILESVNAMLAQSKAIVDETGNTKLANDTLAAHVTQLEGVLRTTGLTQAQIDSYVKSLGLVPSSVSTSVTLNGVAAATQQLNALLAGLAQVPVSASVDAARVAALYNNAINEQRNALAQAQQAAAQAAAAAAPSPTGAGTPIGAASGGTFGPGWLRVGEEGPELVRLGTGGTVFPTDVSAALSALAGVGPGGRGFSSPGAAATVSPSSGNSSGAALHIDTANFNNEADLEVLSRKMNFAVMAGRL